MNQADFSSALAQLDDIGLIYETINSDPFSEARSLLLALDNTPKATIKGEPEKRYSPC